MRHAPVASLVLALAGCGFDDPPMRTTEVHLPRGAGAKSTRLRVSMFGGGLEMKGGANPLVDGALEFNRDAFEPTVRHETIEDGNVESIELAQPEQTGFRFGRARNEWHVGIANDLPATIDVVIGAGAAQIDLAGVALAELSASVNTGSLDVDLAHAKVAASVAVHVQIGTGELRLRLPKDVAVRLRGNEQVGEIVVTGVPQVKGEKGFWQTDDFESAAKKLDVGFRVGMGQATIER